MVLLLLIEITYRYTTFLINLILQNKVNIIKIFIFLIFINPNQNEKTTTNLLSVHRIFE